jgi:hypothetical protein
MLLHKRGTSTTTEPAPAPEPEPTPTPTPTPTGNVLPIARAGADRTIPLSWGYMPTVWGNTSTDSDGWIAGFKWTKISGPTSYLIETPSLNKTKISRLVAGTYVFRLTVTDNKGGVSTDDIKIVMTAN